MFSSLKKTAKYFLATSFLVVANTTAGFLLPAHAETPKLASAKVSFTFDDGLASAYSQAAPTLAKYGLTATDYVTTGCIGMTKSPNACHADPQAKYMSWSQVKALKSTYGWEIGAHSVTHPYLASYNASDSQPNPLTNEQVEKEVAGSKAALAAQGINATAFSTPYGDYNPFTLQTIAKYFSSHRGFADQHDNVYPYNDYLLNNMQVQVPVTASDVKAKIDYAIANDRWLILTFHDIMRSPSKDPNSYEYATRDLESIAAYVKQKQTAGLIRNVNVSDGLVKNASNLLPNSSFENGIADGWSTDRQDVFAADSSTNGSYPSAGKSVKVTAGATSGHLFTPSVAVDRSKVYMIKNYLNVQHATAGEIGFYIDEYDANGNWVSGQYKGREYTQFAEMFNFSYQPSSVAVKTAKLQIYTTAGSDLVAYLDTIEWFQVASTAIVQTNLMPNATFDQGIADGWSTNDPANIVADSQNHGAPENPVKSVSLNANAANGNTHLFSPIINVSDAQSYYLENYLNITRKTSGDVSFYIDEYDANGNWVSGQYRGSTGAIGPQDFAFTYKPTDSNVHAARLQVILIGGSGLSAYLDNSRWTPIN